MATISMRTKSASPPTVAIEGDREEVLTPEEVSSCLVVVQDREDRPACRYTLLVFGGYRPPGPWCCWVCGRPLEERGCRGLAVDARSDLTKPGHRRVRYVAHLVCGGEPISGDG